MDDGMSTLPTTSALGTRPHAPEERFLYEWRQQGLTKEKAKSLIRSFTNRYLENRPMHIYGVVLDSIKVIEVLCAALNSGTLPKGKGGDDVFD
jgi:hypothetical protein